MPLIPVVCMSLLVLLEMRPFDALEAVITISFSLLLIIQTWLKSRLSMTLERKV